MNKSFMYRFIIIIVTIVLLVFSLTSIFVSENSDVITINKEVSNDKLFFGQKEGQSFFDRVFSQKADSEDSDREDKDVEQQDGAGVDLVDVDTDVDIDIDVDVNAEVELIGVIPEDRAFLILINRSNAVTEEFKPEDLVLPSKRASDRAENNQYLVSAAAIAFEALAEAAAAEGHEIVVTTAYRSYGFQQILYDNYVAKDGQEAADRYSARPGTSEHQSGLAADVSSPSVKYKLTQDYANVPEGQWLAENCHRFGFIIRFPEGKEEITGYMYEPWHIRYVGEPVAKYIYDNELTLEEFVELLDE